MAGAQYQPPNGVPGLLNVTDVPSVFGGLVQGSVNLNAQNTGGNTIYVWPVWDGSTPSAADVMQGQQVMPFGTYSSTGTVASDFDGGVTPKFWAVCDPAMTSILSWTART